MKHLKSTEWLLENIHNHNVRIIDCRFQLGNKNSGYESYLQSHIENASYLDLENDLSGPIGQHGGRHPLPDVVKLSKKLSKLGIDHQTTVVAYDDQNGAMASRLWWLLQYMGHSEVFILNGSFFNWKEKGYPITSQIPSFPNKEFNVQIKHELLATVSEVKDKINNPKITMIDSREEKRYLGIEEPIDHTAGHIPGAMNFFWMEGIEKDGIWKESQSQQERFSTINKDQEIIVYCGSGVTACPNIISLYEAGYKNVKLYAGSWSDWISYPDNPIEKQ